MKKRILIVWIDTKKVEHAHEMNGMLEAERFAYALSNTRGVKKVRIIQTEPIMEKHSRIYVDSVLCQSHWNFEQTRMLDTIRSTRKLNMSLLNVMQRLLRENECRCIRCNRKLTDQKSINRGLGPDCFEKLMNASKEFLSYDWEIYNGKTEIQEYLGDDLMWDPTEGEGEISLIQMAPDGDTYHYTVMVCYCPCGGSFEHIDLLDETSINFERQVAGYTSGASVIEDNIDDLYFETAGKFYEHFIHGTNPLCQGCGVNYFSLPLDERGLRYRPDNHDLIKVYEDQMFGTEHDYDAQVRVEEGAKLP